MTQFDWQTDEDDWDTNETAVSSATSVKRKWRRFVFVVLGFLGFAVFGIGFVFLQIQRRAEVATAALSDGLLATHTLMQESAVTGDLELFNLALFPSEKWRETQTELLARQLFWNRSSLGLWLDLESFDPQDTSQVEVTYSPDLQSAEVTAVLPYVTMGDDGQLGAVQLQKTAVYRQVDGGWHYAPFPLVGFWGEGVEVYGRNLSIKAPRRDVELSQKLVQDLDQLIVDVCTLPELTCPSKLQIELVFQIEPESRFRLNQNYRISTIYRADSGRVLQIKMPTPTLVGLPIDEAGYDALYKGYAAQVVARISTYISGQTSTNVPDFQSVNLNPPFPVGFHPQSKLLETPIPFPDQDIVALCRQDGFSPTVFRYTPTLTTWSEEYVSEGDFISQMVSARGYGILLSTSFFATNETWYQLEWIVAGESIIIDISEGGFSLSTVFDYWEEGSQELAILYLKIEDDDWAERLIKVDPTSCGSSSTCSFENLPYLPTFSPEKTHSFVRIIGQATTRGTFDYWLGDDSGQPIAEFEEMSNPMWLSEEQVLLVELTDDTPMQTSLVEANVAGGQVQSEDNNRLLSTIPSPHI